MKILVCSQHPPFPPYEGDSVIAFNLIKQLSRSHTVSSVAFAGNQQEELMNPMDLYCQKAYNVPKTTQLGFIQKAQVFLSRYPGNFGRYNWKEYEQLILEIHQKNLYDVVFFISPILLRLGCLSQRLKSVTVAVPYDYFALNFQRRVEETNNLLEKAYWIWRSRKWQYAHQQLASSFDCLVYVNQEDAEAVKVDCPTVADKIKVIPNGVDTEFFSPKVVIEELDQGQKSRIVFSGNMWSHQSETAIEFFLPIFLRLRQQYPDLEWFIVGRKPTPVIKKLAKENAGIFVTGYVKDIRPYLASATVYVAPIYMGTGIKNRLLEAMSMGCAIVAADRACASLGNKDRLVPIEVAANESEFERSVRHLLSNPQYRNDLAQQAREYVVTYHSWESCSAQYLAVAKQAIERQNRSQT
jgi:polysaccharide biosynthesis protein PslH